MKNLIISTCCVLILSIFSAQAAMLSEGSNNKNIEKNKKVNAKCHVVLVDGSEAIIFYRIKAEKFSKLTNKIVGKRVLTQKSTKKIKVYRAYECVLDKEDFTSQKSQSLDKKTER